MLRALHTAATGMHAQQVNIDTIANNIANVNTTGYKQARAEFQDLLYQDIRPAGTSSSSTTEYPTGIQVGLGTALVATARDYSQGDFRQTGNQLDLVISGKGFFQVQIPSGEIAYTRDGSFHQNADGTIVTADGHPLEPQITVPSDALELTIGQDGTVTTTNELGETQTIGAIQLAQFQNPAGLAGRGQNLLSSTTASGDPLTGAPGEVGLGMIRQGLLEQSNVNVVEEMVNMIVAQRAYEVNSRALRVADDMLQQVNNLVR